MPHWLKFKERGPGCMHSSSVDEAVKEAERLTGFVPVSCVGIPYGAYPSIDKSDGGDFCMHPDKCAGRGACPRDFACSE